MNSNQPNVSEMVGRSRLRVNFVDFSSMFRANEFWIYKFLAERFEVVIDPICPELVVFCDYGIEHLQYSCCKIYYSHEIVDPNQQFLAGPNPRLCDYSFSFLGHGGNHHYFSNLVEEEFFEDLRSGEYREKLRRMRGVPKSKFCNFVYANKDAQERIHFCQLLMTYKGVDCPGPVLNNCPPFDAHNYMYERKLEFLRSYKFTIAFENRSHPKYTTEKIIHPLIAGSIPIYWGNPEIAKLINPKCFINCHEFADFHEVVARIKEIDENDGLFAEYTSAPVIPEDSPLASLSETFLRERVTEIVRSARTKSCVSQAPGYPLVRISQFLKFKMKMRVAYFSERLREWIGRSRGKSA